MDLDVLPVSSLPAGLDTHFNSPPLLSLLLTALPIPPSPMPSFSQSGLKTILSEDGLQVRIYYLECMAQATYIVSHEGAAFIVDPRRDVDAYIKVRAYKHIAHGG